MFHFDNQQCHEVLRDKFGLEAFRPKQLEVIERILNRQHTLALLPTGYGKSICYQVPAQMLHGVTVVVSPLIALMQDQLNGLLKRGITSATMLNSTLDYAQMSSRFAGIRSGAYKLVYVSPERFDSERFRCLLSSVDISLMVIDEAHCISQWGHDFRPQYRNLGTYVREFGNATLLAVTATATPNVKNDIIRNLALEDIAVVEGSFDRPNLLFSVKEVSASRDKDLLVERQLLANAGGAIIYTSSRKEAERVNTMLRKKGFKTACYHAGLPVERRQRAQRAFEEDKLDVIVCTVAFGMGVDKPNIRQVIHNNLPGSLESYYQEAGRAGRDGNPALCTLFFQSKDIHIQKWLINQKDVAEELKRVDRQRLESMIDYAQTRTCRRRRILSYFGQSLMTCQGCDVCNQSLVDSFEANPERRQTAGIPPAAKSSTRSAVNRDVSVNAKTSSSNLSTQSNSTTVAQLSGDLKLKVQVLALALGLSGKVGRTSLAQILSGSRARKLKAKGFDRLPQFASCADFTQETIVCTIDGLVDQGYLRVSSGLYPKVALTAAGRMYFSTLS